MPQQLVGINLPGDPALGGVRLAQLLGSFAQQAGCVSDGVLFIGHG